jgi:hypothetical protein
MIFRYVWVFIYGPPSFDSIIMCFYRYYIVHLYIFMVWGILKFFNNLIVIIQWCFNSILKIYSFPVQFINYKQIRLLFLYIIYIVLYYSFLYYINIRWTPVYIYIKIKNFGGIHIIYFCNKVNFGVPNQGSRRRPSADRSCGHNWHKRLPPVYTRALATRF